VLAATGAAKKSGASVIDGSEMGNISDTGLAEPRLSGIGRGVACPCLLSWDRVYPPGKNGEGWALAEKNGAGIAFEFVRCRVFLLGDLSLAGGT